MGLTPSDPPTAEANDTEYLGSGANSQTAVLGEQGMPRINMLNVYKQGAIGGIDIILRGLYEASGALDIAIPLEPYQSPFSAPADVNDQTARLMGGFQFPALIGAAADLDFFENPGDAQKSGANFGQAATNHYRSTFFAENPELKGEVFVHHAVEQKVLTKFPGVVTEGEMHSLENLRGIPLDINNDIHLSQIRKEWDRFYEPFIEAGTAPTKAQLLQKATEIDSMFGSTFMPPVGGE